MPRLRRFLSHLLPSTLRVGLCIAGLLASATPGGAQDAQLMTRAIDDLAVKLVEKLPKQRPLRLAVPSFADLENGRKTAIGRHLANELASALVEKGGVDIAERADNSLDQLIDEVRLSESGLVDKDTARKLKLKGVDVIAACSMTVFETYVNLNCRAIEAGSGSVLTAARSRLAIDSDVKILLTKALGIAGPAGRNDERKDGTRESGKSEPPTAKALSVRAEQFLFELRSCTKSGTSVTCSFMITNEGQERKLGIYASDARIVDEAGNEARGVQASLGSQQNQSSLEVGMIPGVPLRMSWTFQGPLAQSALARAIDLKFYQSNGEPFLVRFFNVSFELR